MSEILNKDDMFRIGVITEPHGVSGEVKVFPTTDEPGRMGRLKVVYMEQKGELIPLHPLGARPQKNLMIMKFQEFEDRDAVERLRKCELFITRDNAVKLRRDEYYISDLIGLSCVDEDNNKVGILSEVYETGANDVYEITKDDGSKVLLPAIKQCILDVDVAGGIVKVHILEGL